MHISCIVWLLARHCKTSTHTYTQNMCTAIVAFGILFLSVSSFLETKPQPKNLNFFDKTFRLTHTHIQQLYHFIIQRLPHSCFGPNQIKQNNMPFFPYDLLINNGKLPWSVYQPLKYSFDFIFSKFSHHILFSSFLLFFSHYFTGCYFCADAIVDNGDADVDATAANLINILYLHSFAKHTHKHQIIIIWLLLN